MDAEWREVQLCTCSYSFVSVFNVSVLGSKATRDLQCPHLHIAVCDLSLLTICLVSSSNHTYLPMAVGAVSQMRD